MVAAAWTGAQDADLVVFLVDAKAGLTPQVEEIAKKLGERGGKIWLVLNKTDLVEPQRLLPLVGELNQRATFAETFMVSASTGDGLAELMDHLAAAMPEGPHLYPEDDLTDLPDRLLAAELVREQIFLQIQQEIPYATTVETETWQERKDGSVRVEATIYVGRANHKAILIGERGARIKEIGARARADLSRLLERPVHLFLNVKERAGWDEEGARLRAIGLEDPPA
jgi:GTP-binding protein Era